MCRSLVIINHFRSISLQFFTFDNDNTPKSRISCRNRIALYISSEFFSSSTDADNTHEFHRNYVRSTKILFHENYLNVENIVSNWLLKMFPPIKVKVVGTFSISSIDSIYLSGKISKSYQSVPMWKIFSENFTIFSFLITSRKFIVISKFGYLAKHFRSLFLWDRP